MSVRSAITLIGTVVGAWFGYPQLGYAIGSLVGNAVDPVKVYGPKLSDAKIQTARDGIPITWGAGHFRTAGTVFYVQPGPPTEHEQEESSKGGGPEQVTYSYTRTHAILVCRGPAIGIRRIWRDEKLVYDASTLPTEAHGDYSLDELLRLAMGAKASSVSFAEKMTIYLGDDMQLPDPDLEAIFGVGEVYAHRGYVYVVFKDDDVTARGGSISNYEFEVVKAGSVHEVIGENYALDLGPAFYYPMQDDPCVDATGNRATLIPGNTYTAGDGITFSFPAPNDPTGVVQAPSGALQDGLGTYTVMVRFRIDSVDSVTGQTGAKMIFYHGLSFPNWYMALFSGTGNVDPTFMTPNLLINGGGGGGFGLDSDSPVTVGSVNTMAFRQNGSLLELIVNNVVVASRNDISGGFSGSALLGGGANSFAGNIAHAIGFNRALSDAEMVNLSASFGVIPDGWLPVPGSPGWYVDLNGDYHHIGGSYSYIIAESVDLAEFVTEICEQSELTADDIDVSDLVGTWLDGFLVARETNGQALISILAQAFFFDAFEQDGKIVFARRGRPTVANLTIDNLLEQDGDSAAKETRDQEIERPRKINVNYYDPELQYIPSKQTAERLATVAAIGETSLELPIVMSKDFAAQIADKLLKASWVDLLGAMEFALSDEFAYLVPGDCVMLDYRNKSQRLRIDKIDDEEGRKMIVARQDRLSAYDSNAIGHGTYQNPSYPEPPSATIFAAFNLPWLRQEDVGIPGIYVVARGRSAGWPGCVVQISFDAGASFVDLVTIKQSSTIGALSSAADDPATSPAVENFDVQVEGSISSVSVDQIAAGANAFAIADSSDVAEVGQVQTVIDNGSGSYTLVNPLRALEGSEGAAHAIGERFALLGNSYFCPVDAAFAEATLVLRAVTIGAPADTGEEIELVYRPTLEIIHDGGWLS